MYLTTFFLMLYLQRQKSRYAELDFEVNINGLINCNLTNKIG